MIPGNRSGGPRPGCRNGDCRSLPSGYCVCRADHGGNPPVGEHGTTWDPLASFGRGVLPYRFLASVDTPVVFLGATDAGLFVASANRRQWRKLLLGDLPPNTGAHTVAIDPWKPSTWYAGTDGHGILQINGCGHDVVRLEWNIDRPFRVHGRGSCDRRLPPQSRRGGSQRPGTCGIARRGNSMDPFDRGVHADGFTDCPRPP